MFVNLIFKTLLLFFIAPAFSQSGNLEGEYDLIGRRCVDGSLIPLGDSIQKMIFRSGGRFEGTYRSIPDPNEMTHEEWKESVRERGLEWFEEDKAAHEAACRQHGDVREEDGSKNLCEREARRKLYSRWREQRLREAEELIRENEEQMGYDGSQDDESPCEMRSFGSWEASGGRLTIVEMDLEASSSCHLSGSGPRRRIQGSYYFEAGRLHLVQPSNVNSREFCGSSNWEAVLFPIPKPQLQE